MAPTKPEDYCILLRNWTAEISAVRPYMSGQLLVYRSECGCSSVDIVDGHEP